MNDKNHGILLLDKPTNLSSNNVLQKVRYLFNEKKAGYIGTLDPIASGMLPICFGEATKFSQFLSDSNKRYHVIARLGQTTDTMDAYGKIIKVCSVKITYEQLINTLNRFHGVLTQIPPMYSAIKYRGQPLYQYARNGITIERKLRKIIIHELKCKSWCNNKLELEIYCSKGTYIRVIINDIGNILGCGAHIIYLRRLQVGNYFSDKMVSLIYLYEIMKNNQLSFSIKKTLNSFILPIETMVNMLDKIKINLSYSICFKKGVPLMIKHDFKIGDKIRVIESQTDSFIGIGKIDKFKRLVPSYLIKNKN